MSAGAEKLGVENVTPEVLVAAKAGEPMPEQLRPDAKRFLSSVDERDFGEVVAMGRDTGRNFYQEACLIRASLTAGMNTSGASKLREISNDREARKRPGSLFTKLHTRGKQLLAQRARAVHAPRRDSGRTSRPATNARSRGSRRSGASRAGPSSSDDDPPSPEVAEAPTQGEPVFPSMRFADLKPRADTGCQFLADPGNSPDGYRWYCREEGRAAA